MTDSEGNGAYTVGVFGTALAMIVSWSINKSIGWAIWHGILGWIYVIYRWIVGI